jgi:hypothetical protein
MTPESSRKSPQGECPEAKCEGILATRLNPLDTDGARADEMGVPRARWLRCPETPAGSRLRSGWRSWHHEDGVTFGASMTLEPGRSTAPSYERVANTKLAVFGEVAVS